MPEHLHRTGWAYLGPTSLPKAFASTEHGFLFLFFCSAQNQKCSQLLHLLSNLFESYSASKEL